LQRLRLNLANFSDALQKLIEKAGSFQRFALNATPWRLPTD
jgi:hypothetical protein